jgi:hypothetical protein
MESKAEHQEVPTEDAIVKPVEGRKKRHRGRHLAAGRCGEPKELTRGHCGFQRKLAATCRKVSHRAAMAWRKRNVFRKIRTRGNCGPWRELAAAGRRMTHSTKVARRRGHDRKRYDQDNVVQETRIGRTFGKRRWKGPECNSGIRDRGLRHQLRQQVNKKPRHKMAAVSEDWDNIRWIWQEGFRTGVHEASNWDVQWVAANQELESMEGSAPSEVRKTY